MELANFLQVGGKFVQARVVEVLAGIIRVRLDRIRGDQDRLRIKTAWCQKASRYRRNCSETIDFFAAANVAPIDLSAGDLLSPLLAGLFHHHPVITRCGGIGHGSGMDLALVPLHSTQAEDAVLGSVLKNSP
jgi:hypothetical protein